MSATAKVFDSDVVLDEENMRNLAVEVALAYSGNWEAMIGWQQHCRAGRPLGITQIRAILNAALSDVGQSGYWPTIRRHLPQRSPGPPRGHVRLRVVRDEEEDTRRVFVRLNATWNSYYFRPNHRMGKIHLIDSGRTVMEWKHPYDWEHPGGVRYDIPKMPHLIVHGWCGKRYDNPLMPDDPDNHDEICAGCRKVRAEFGTPPSARRICR